MSIKFSQKIDARDARDAPLHVLSDGDIGDIEIKK